MENQRLEHKLNQEVLDFIHARKTVQLATVNDDGSPYASYAPYAIADGAIYVLISEIANHTPNLIRQPQASLLIVEDEVGAKQLYARKRVNYSVEAEMIELNSEAWRQGLNALRERQGEMVDHLAQLEDFKLFRLNVLDGRFVKGFGKAFELTGGTLAGEHVNRLTGDGGQGHRKRETQTA